MAYKQPSSGPFKMMGSSPAKDGQATKGKLKKTFTGPVKPMADEDGDGIPTGIDIKDSPGGKQFTEKKKYTEQNHPEKNKKVNKQKPTTNGKPIEKRLKGLQISKEFQMPDPNKKPTGYGLDR